MITLICTSNCCWFSITINSVVTLLIYMLAIITSDLKTEQHICKILSSAASSMYALGIPRNHGLTGKALLDAARARTIAQVMYASPARWGFTSQNDRDQIDRLLSRMKRRGFPRKMPGT